MSTPADLTGMAAAMERIVEGSPVIVAILSVIGLVVWRAWRDERREMMIELREERQARAAAHKEMLAMADRSTEAVHAVREALTDLRHAIKDRG